MTSISTKVVGVSLGVAVGFLVLVAILAPGIKFAGASSATNVVASVSVPNFCDLTVSNTAITFGGATAVSAGTGVAAANEETVLNSNGNLNAFIWVSGNALWTSNANSFTVGYTLWNPTTSAVVGVGNQLTAAAANTQIPVLSASSNDIFFGLNAIAINQPSGIYTQNVQFLDSCPSSPSPVNSVTVNVVFTVNIASTCTISLSPTTISFGSLAPTQSANTANGIVDTNTGGSPANIVVYGSNWIGPGSANFLVGNTLWDPTSQTSYTGNALGLAPGTVTDIYLPANVAGATTNNIYFGVHIPGAIQAGAYSQNIVIENSC
jgi:hypothetical protein